LVYVLNKPKKMDIQAKEKLSESIPSSWILKRQGHITQNEHQDELIDAYLKGREEQKNQNQKILFEKLEANIKTAQTIVVDIVNQIAETGFKMYKSYLKIDNITKFDVIFDIAVQDYLSPQFDEIYKLSHEIKSKYNNDTFNISFAFMPHSEFINERRINCEGFIFSYDKQK
jgi:hypothetical protein